jgi:hypothetical protein
VSDQADQANAFARAAGGAQVDPLSAGVAAGAPEQKKEAIRVKLPQEGHRLSDTAKELGAVLKMNGVFRRDQSIVTIGRDDEGHARFERMTAQRLRSYVEKLCVTGKWRAGGQDEPPVFKAVTMSPEVAVGVLESDTFREQQRPVRRLNEVRMPVMRADQRIELLAPGYDPEARVYTFDSGIDVRDDWTVEQARAYIRDLLREFPLEGRREDGTSRSEAVIVAGMLSLFGIGLLGQLTSRMHFCVTANSERSGKSLLVKMIIVPVCGPAKARAKPENSEELRKELASAALSGTPYFFLDDLDGLLKSQELNAFMTSSTLGGRMLGGLSEYSAEKQCVVFITGNNLALSSDIANRVLRASLFTEEADVQSRPLSRTIDEEWLCRPEVRGDILSALWAMIKAWDKAGRPKGKRVFRGFEQWCAVFGGIVAHAGFGEPCEPPPLDDTSGATDDADMRTLVEVLVADMETRPYNLPAEAEWVAPKKKTFEFQELVDACVENSCFEWHLDGTSIKDKDTGTETLRLTPKSRSYLGKQFAAKAGGRKFRLKDGRMVQFGKRGKNRGKRFEIEMVG